MEYILGIVLVIYLINSGYQMYTLNKVVQAILYHQQPAPIPTPPTPEQKPLITQEALDKELEKYYKQDIGNLLENINKIMVGDNEDGK